MKDFILLFLLKAIENALFAFVTVHVMLIYRCIFNTSQRGILSHSAIQKSFLHLISPDCHCFCVYTFTFFVCLFASVLPVIFIADRSEKCQNELGFLLNKLLLSWEELVNSFGR